MRIDKFLADCGFGTRTEVKKLIKSGAVVADGIKEITPKTQIDEETQKVFVNDVRAVYKKYIYLMLNKPKGYVSATWDKKLPTVVDLLPQEYRHFEPFPVGRLDIDTEGLLLLTNDGDLGHRLLSPKSHIPKTYIAHLEKPATEKDKEAFKKGIKLEEDFTTLPAELEIIKDLPFCAAQVTIYEGKFHQVKRMFEAVGNKVLYLKRIRMKNLVLDAELSLGKIRELTNEEVAGLCE